MTDITEELEQYAKAVMPGYPNDVCSRAKAEIERLRAALESLTEDPPATLDEPDEDWEVIIKMRALARAALAGDTRPSEVIVREARNAWPQ